MTGKANMQLVFKNPKTTSNLLHLLSLLCDISGFRFLLTTNSLHMVGIRATDHSQVCH